MHDECFVQFNNKHNVMFSAIGVHLTELGQKRQQAILLMGYTQTTPSQAKKHNVEVNVACDSSENTNHIKHILRFERSTGPY